jgi:hypothetical protein
VLRRAGGVVLGLLIAVYHFASTQHVACSRGPPRRCELHSQF